MTTKCDFKISFPSTARVVADTDPNTLDLPYMKVDSQPLTSLRPRASGPADGGEVIIRPDLPLGFGPIGSGGSGEGEDWEATFSPIRIFGLVGDACWAQLATFSRINRRSLVNNAPPNTATEFVLANNFGPNQQLLQWLDVGFPYTWSEGNNTPPHTWPIGVEVNGVITPRKIFGSDSPKHILELSNMDGSANWTNRWEKAIATDTFKTWLMYRPPQKDNEPTTWVPIASFPWSWHGRCFRDPETGEWVLDSASIVDGDKNLAPELIHPTWVRVKGQGDFPMVPN